MRPGRFIEIGAWFLGIALLGLYSAARVSAERARVDGIETYREGLAAPSRSAASAVARPVAETPPASDAVPAAAESRKHRAIEVDQSLWSAHRISAFAESVASTGMPEGVLSIPALQLEVPVYAGVNEVNLTRGAAHIEGTAGLSGEGNIGLAAHRDGFFRKLKNISVDDELELDVDGRLLRYRVVDLGIVSPSDVHVLAPTRVPSVTLVTCYPFYFIGTAPQRYIVRAELIATPPASAESS